MSGIHLAAKSSKYSSSSCQNAVDAAGGLQKIDITHPFAGSGGKQPSFLYEVSLHKGVRAAVAIKETTLRCDRRINPQCSARLLAVKSIFRLATQNLGKPTFKMFRQPFLALLCPVLKETHTHHADLAHCRAWWVTANRSQAHSRYRSSSKTQPNCQVLYVHGGGCVGGDYAGFRGFCSKLSLELGHCDVLVPNYRFCPEWTLSQGVDDLVDCLELMMRPNPSEPSLPVALVGDSGGCIYMFLLLQRLKKENRLDLMPYCCVCMSPMVTIVSSFDQLARDDYCSTTMLEWCCMLIHAADPEAEDPIEGDFTECCPMYICTAESELLSTDTRRLEIKLRQDGVHVEVCTHTHTFEPFFFIFFFVYTHCICHASCLPPHAKVQMHPHAFHAWPLMWGLGLKESISEIENIVNFIDMYCNT